VRNTNGMRMRRSPRRPASRPTRSAISRPAARPERRRRTRRAIYDFVQELYKTRRVSERTYKRVHGFLGDSLMVELVGILGYYGLVAMMLDVFNVMLPEGADAAVRGEMTRKRHCELSGLAFGKPKDELREAISFRALLSEIASLRSQ